MREYSLLSFGSDAWLTHRQAGWDAFLRQFLPGLFAVARGRLQFVGLAPRSRAEIERMPPEWRAMYLKSKAGLVTEAASASIDAEDDTQLYLVEAYYNARRSFIYDLRLVYRYFIRLIVPVNTAQPKAQTNLVDS
jgi:lipopolysaccharide/colanic/teichoic acid biosynthesis glycosyltransferase